LKPNKGGPCRSSHSESENVTASVSSNHQRQTPEEEHHRMARWICELLLSHVKKIIATRKVHGQAKSESKTQNIENLVTTNGRNLLDEVVEAIALPSYKRCDETDLATVEIDENVEKQLQSFISTIASTYRENHFHNFEHACHVTMSVNKLLYRIVTPNIDIDDDGRDVASHFHDYSYGINSDPITILAIIFSAVVHDADHRGVSNVQMMKEEEGMAKMYDYKSIAEQNSLDIAWNILMLDEFTELRSCLFQSEDDLKRFRQVLVNLVLATDIFDKDLNELRKQRWVKAFAEGVVRSSDENTRNIRAMIIMEHIIQASDVSHTMQHWHVYRKWNEKLFKEMYTAFKSGRMGADPAEFWYKGELSFFDNYIIPLAKKLKECQVFGVSSDEYLNYAEQNRLEWEERGQEIVLEMIAEVKCFEGEDISDDSESSDV
jgi:3'5'-cyclic nucleotide phosphodiesterase